MRATHRYHNLPKKIKFWPFLSILTLRAGASPAPTLLAPNKWGRYNYLSIPRLANRIGNDNCPLCLNDIMATDDMGAIQNPYDDG